jgi:hypothetical protein
MKHMAIVIHNQPVVNWWFLPLTGTPDVKGLTITIQAQILIQKNNDRSNWAVKGRGV